MSNLSNNKLLPIAECPDLMVDACLWDSICNLVFVSIWGRDTAIQTFLGRLSLGRTQDGLDHFHIINEHDRDFPIFVESVNRLEKQSARTYRQTLFGSLSHIWLYDKRCKTIDKANSSAMLLLPKEAENTTERIWSMVKETCPLPLLDHWRDPVLDILKHYSMFEVLPKGIGEVNGYQLNLDIENLKRRIGEKIRQGILKVEDSIKPLSKAA